MKKLILITILVGLIAVPALGNATLDGVSPHLGWWDPDHPRATHQYWDFAVNVVVDGGLWDWEADPPTEMINQTLAKAFIQGVYDDVEDWFTGDPLTGNIEVQLQIGNFIDNPYKEIWVDIGFDGTLTGSAKGTGGGLTYTTIDLPPYSDIGGVAELGFKIFPNPEKEDIFLTIAPGAVPAKLEWVHVDTICIPAPGAILLGSIGVGLVGWLRRRRTL